MIPDPRMYSDWREFASALNQHLLAKENAFADFVDTSVIRAITQSADFTLTPNYIGTRTHLTGAARVVTTPSSTDITWPVGAWAILSTGSAAGGSTIVAGSGITLAWFTGAAVTTGSPRTLAAGSIVWLYRRSNTTFDAWGWGIS